MSDGKLAKVMGSEEIVIQVYCSTTKYPVTPDSSADVSSTSEDRFPQFNKFASCRTCQKS
ncbi:hypothetical protein [Desulfomonile tiedjei]|uniref:hypothetical protein n=1 Tax=Desulfomonile tiedjei TaxID=2358 RepID=UPI000316023B|nr:hypothetical protein [Desulfomonile tiedjei]